VGRGRREGDSHGGVEMSCGLSGNKIEEVQYMYARKTPTEICLEEI